METTPKPWEGRRGESREPEGKRERDGIKELIIRDVTRLVPTQRVGVQRVSRRVKSRQVGQRSLSRSFYLVARFLCSFLSPSKLQPTGAEAAHRQERRSALKESFLFQMRWEVVKIELPNFMDGKSYWSRLGPLPLPTSRSTWTDQLINRNITNGDE